MAGMDMVECTLEPSALRSALGAFVTGVTVITTRDQSGRAHGLTANSFNTVSLEPPLILWSQSKSAGSHEVFRAADQFAVSILAEDQVDVSKRFATARADKFEGVAVDHAFCALPVLPGSSAWLHCRTVSRVDGGDHTIYIGRIEKIARSGRGPLVFGSGGYMLAQRHHALLPGESQVPLGARQRHAVRICTPYAERLAKESNVTICVGVWGNCGPTIVGWETGPESVLPGFPLGLVLPVTTSATGKALAAFLPPTLTAPLVDAEFQAGASPRWLDTLADIRQRRMALHEPARFWNEDVLIRAGSVPIRGTGGDAIVALTAVLPAQDDPAILPEICALLKETADKVEQQLTM